MKADDPRHGTNAGAVAHWRAGSKPCAPCRAAARRARIARDLDQLRGQPRTVKLGDDAWRIIHETPRNQLAAAVGMKHERLQRYDRGGPAMRVHRTTRDRILAARVAWSTVGIQRRLHALAALGWSARQVASRCDIAATTIHKIRRRDAVFVRRRVAEEVLRVYAELSMLPAPTGPSATETRNYAAAQGWLPPLAWDNIDDPSEQPRGVRRPEPRSPVDVDPVNVDRLVEGRPVENSTRAEKDEAMRRWRAAGKSEASLCRIHGWHEGRYGKGAAA